VKELLIRLAEKHRTFLTRLFALAIIPVYVFSGSTFPSWNQFFELIGIFLLAACAFGRLWASLYISGNKIDKVVSVGPYSIVRHPLYFFSFMGILGIGFVSKNMLVFASLVAFFAFLYPLVIISEEKELMERHGDDYVDYMKTVPRFFPNLLLLKEPASYDVHTIIFRNSILDAVWFVLGLIPLKILDALRSSGIIPCIF